MRRLIQLGEDVVEGDRAQAAVVDDVDQFVVDQVTGGWLRWPMTINCGTILVGVRHDVVRRQDLVVAELPSHSAVSL